MGFLSKIRNRVKAQIQPGNMIARDMGPGNMPKRPDIFGRDSFLFGRRPRGNMGSNFRMPQKRGGGMGGLAEAIRRLNEQRDMRMPRMPQPIPERMPIDRSSYFNPTIFGQPIPEEGADFSNMPDFSQIDMSNLQMPTLPREISQMDLPQMPEGLPSMEEIETAPRMPQMRPMNMPPRAMMAEGDVAEKETLIDFLTKDRRGRKPGNAFSLGKDIYDFVNQPEPSAQMSPEQEVFSLQTQLENLREQLRLDRSYNDLQTIVDTSAEIEAIQKRMVEIQMEMARQKMIGENPYNLPFDPDAKAAREKLEEERRPALEEEYRSNPYNYPFNKISIEERKRLREQGFAGGGEASFPDLTGDGQVTQADILKGRGVKMMYGGEMKGYENGGEIEGMLSGMESPMGEEEAMAELEQVQPEMEMIEQLVMMVTQMIQQGASEQEVMGLLREQGLDDEDIATVLQLVAEMGETEDQAEATAAQNEIGNQLTELG